jgi:hypothetical protein
MFEKFYQKEPPKDPITLLAEQHKTDIEKIKKLKCHYASKIEMILMLLGEKPASTFALTSKDDSAETIAKTLRDAGLKVAIETKEEKYHSLIIARDQSSIDKIQALHQIQRKKDEVYQEQYGELVGYPKTATAAFAGKIPSMGEKESWKLDPTLIYSIIYSKDHWQEEIKLMRKWTETIKKYAPDLYEEALKKRNM